MSKKASGSKRKKGAQETDVPLPIELAAPTRGVGEESGHRATKAKAAGKAKCRVCGQAVKVVDLQQHSVLAVHYRTLFKGHKVPCMASGVMVCVTAEDFEPSDLTCLCRRPKRFWQLGV